MLCACDITIIWYGHDWVRGRRRRRCCWWCWYLICIWYICVASIGRITCNHIHYRFRSLWSEKRSNMTPNLKLSLFVCVFFVRFLSVHLPCVRSHKIATNVQHSRPSLLPPPRADLTEPLRVPLNSLWQMLKMNKRNQHSQHSGEKEKKNFSGIQLMFMSQWRGLYLHWNKLSEKN